MIFLSLSFLSSTAAFEFDFNSPESIEQNEEFTVSVVLETQEKYDIKIFVHDSEDDKIERDEYLSEIDDGGWKDSWFYLKETFPDEKDYSIRATRGTGDKAICVRLRKSGTDSFGTVCKEISISASDEEESQESEEDEEKEQETHEEKIEKESDIKENISIKQISQPIINEEKILLNPKKISEEPKTMVTKQHSIRNGIVYGFLLVCVVIIILLALKKL